MTQEEKEALAEKIKQFGLEDLRKIAPIGYLGYANGWYSTWDNDDKYLFHEMPIAIYEAFQKQKKTLGITAEEIGMSWDVDSSD